VLVNFVGGPDTTIAEINEAAELIGKRCASDCLFLFGYGQREELEGLIQVTVIATGFGASAEDRPVTRPADRQLVREPARQEPKAEVNPYLPPNLPSDYGVNVGNLAEFDTPTYLRRQLD
jgi:cell division GTPase FtsZ